MKDGDKFVELVNRRNALKYLWLLFSSPILMRRDHIDWLDFYQANKN